MNKDVRIAARQARVPLWKIADALGVSEATFTRMMRRELPKYGVKHLTVLFSEEQPVRIGMREPASISFVPSAAGLMIAGHCIRKLCGIEGQDR